MNSKRDSLEGDWYKHQNKLRINYQQLEIDERSEAITYQQWISVTLYLLGLLIISIIVLYLRGFYLQWQSQRFLKVQVGSRVDKLKHDEFSLNEHGGDRVSSEAFELGERMESICDQMKGLFDKHPQVLGIESEHFEYVASAYREMNDDSRVLSIKNG